MTRFSLLGLLLVSLFFVTSCGDDDSDATIDLTDDIVGTYDGNYFYQDDTFIINEMTTATIAKLDDNTIRIQFNADDIDYDFQADMLDATAFLNNAIMIDGDAGYGVAGAINGNNLTITISDDEDAEIIETFTGVRQ